jgi:cell division protein FtsZ
MGGGTGTGAAPVIAQVARELGILTVAVVTKPFRFEMKKRMMVADQGIEELNKNVDSLIVIPNDKLLQAFKGLRIKEAFKAADDVLLGAVQGISDLITAPGQMNVDFNDVKTVMSETGFAIMGSGEASGESRAREAAEMAMSSPLLDDIDLHGARAVLVNITSSDDMTIDEFQEVGDAVAEFASENATVIIGMAIDETLTDELRVTVVATGLGDTAEPSMQLVHTTKEPIKPAVKPQTLSKAATEKKSTVPVLQRQAGATPTPASASTSAQGPAAKKVANGGMSYLDIPAFLRKQAD